MYDLLDDPDWAAVSGTFCPSLVVLGVLGGIGVVTGTRVARAS